MRDPLFAEGTIIALDTPAFAYHADRHPRYFALSDVILEALATGASRGVASVLILAEALAPFHRAGRADAARALQQGWRSLPGLAWVQIGPSLADQVARLRAMHNLRTPDAIHLATAIQAGADWFVTDDHRLRRVEPEGIRVWLFDEHVEER